MTDEAGEFLKKLGLNSEQHQGWSQIITPPKVVIILGKRGSGKTGLAMYLLETISQEYKLAPVVVNFPRTKVDLLPDFFQIKSLEEVKGCNNSIILIDEGSTLIPAGKAKLEELIKAFSALSRQREQLILLIFHASADVGTRILRGVDTLIFKEPSLRQIQWGSKDDYFRQLLLEAKEKLSNRGTQYSYVDSEVPEFRGVLENPLPSFWSEKVSKAWAGVEILDNQLFQPLKRAGTQQEVLNIPNIDATDNSNPFWYTMEELKQKCVERGLSKKGNKLDLVKRLFLDDQPFNN